MAETPVKFGDLKPGMRIPAAPLVIVSTSWTEDSVEITLSDGTTRGGSFTDAIYVEAD